MASEQPIGPTEVGEARAAESATLTARFVVITGGGRGIGRELAHTLARHGAAVGLVARTETEIDDAVAAIERTGGVAAGAVADVTDTKSVARAFAHLRREFGPPDVLVNNAGVLGPVGPLWEIEATDWWRTMEVNLGGMVVCTQLVLPDMVARRHGRILNLASRAGIYRWPLVSAYSVSKAAVVKFSENLARETSRYGISVLSVHPGLLTIGFAEKGLDAAAAPGSYMDGLRAWVLDEFESGRGTATDDAMQFLLRLVRGDADVLSGSHISVQDDLDAMIQRSHDVHDRDLYVLRRTGLVSEPAARASA